MIYLDNNATTPIDPAVVEAMEEAYRLTPLNPSSAHHFGQRARSLLATSSKKIASFFGVEPDELIFTSGATEALNLAVRGLLPRGHIITSTLEHSATLKSIEQVERTGTPVTYLYPEKEKGAVSAAQVEEALRPDTRLIVMMGANNETGVKSDLEALSALANEREIALLVDGVALLGKDTFTLPEGVSMACFSGHKIHGPLGIGLLIVKRGVSLSPLMMGGPQQEGRRAGTENLPGIVGLAHALELLDIQDRVRMERLRNQLEEGLLKRLPSVHIHGKEERRVSNTSCCSFLGVEGEMALMQLDLAGVAVGYGAACGSGNLEPSHVLRNMGLPQEMVASSLRFSLSRFTTDEEIAKTIEVVTDTIGYLVQALDGQCFNCK